jgi:hypothetical protein
MPSCSKLCWANDWDLCGTREWLLPTFHVALCNLMCLLEKKVCEQSKDVNTSKTVATPCEQPIFVKVSNYLEEGSHGTQLGGAPRRGSEGGDIILRVSTNVVVVGRTRKERGVVTWNQNGRCILKCS